MSRIRFDGQVVLVTGAGRGLGAAYARAFAARGASVVVHDAGVDPDGSGGDRGPADAIVAEIAAAGGTAVACYENLESESGCLATVDAALERFGRLDVAVQNAGLVIWEELDEAHRSWERMRRVSIDAPFHITRAAFPVMKRQQYGRFVFTTSGRAMAVERTRPGLAAYSAGKMAQFGLMIVTAAEGAPHGVLANAISPAAATRVLRRAVQPGELEPEQVVPGVLFLASERCMVSGKVLEAAGGEFDVARWASSQGWAASARDEASEPPPNRTQSDRAEGDRSFGREPVEPDVIAERWSEIEGVVNA